MSFMDTVERARAVLQRNGRISLRALEEEYSLGQRMDALVEELVEVQRVARRDGSVLVWVGEGAAEQTAASPTAPAAPDTAQSALDSGERRQFFRGARDRGTPRSAVSGGRRRTAAAREAKAALDELAARLAN